MLKMTKNSAMGGLLEPIKNSADRKSVLHEALLLGKFEAHSVLHTMYLWMRVG